MAEQVRQFCEELERDAACQDWQVRQAEHALRIYFVDFLQRTDWHRRPISKVVDENGGTDPLAALEQLRTRIRTRHYSYRTECSYADWVRRFLGYFSERQDSPHPRVDSESVRDFLSHLAVRRQVSASTQNSRPSARRGSRLIEAGWPVHHVQHMLGHASLQQTSTYLNATLRGLHDRCGILIDPAPLASTPSRGLRPARKQAPAQDGKSLLH
ncbi:MAG: site-specific integrase [Acidobacteriota bacterium]